VAGVARHVANVRVRTVGTVGGNLAFADPHSDLATLFLALDAGVRLWSRRGEREVALAEFVRGPYETACEAHEVLSAIRLPLWPAGTAATYLKFGVHERPTLGVAAALVPGAAGAPATLRLTVGCVGPRPQRLLDVEAMGGTEGAPAIAARAENLAALAGREVLTVEGLADGEALHPLQEAFVAHGAVQCGFCTSGMLLSAKALLAEDPAPTRERIVHYLRGNLCRCTGYQKIIDAIAAAAGRLRARA
jgi:xanthine dehydrogenase iron-sulfur cluster and FAD-binding subunit A